MNIKRQSVKLVAICALMALTSPSFEENAPLSITEHIQSHHSKDPIDGGWLPNLTGLPDKKTIDVYSEHIKDVMGQEEEKKCTAINSHLRMMVFQHFVIHQAMANSQNIYFDKKIAHQWAHVLGMILKESSGDSANITDMKGRSISTYSTLTDLKHWQKIFNLTLKNQVKLDTQTNFGLSQTSSDRLFNAFHLAKNQYFDTEFLEGKKGAQTPKKVTLNTAIAIRRLIWFYQDFAQGRISQEDGRIHEKDITKPEYSDRYKAGVKMALLYCGTKFMFKHPHKNYSILEDTLAKISYCKLGNARTGYGKNEFDEKCFAEWVTLCPSLNVDIAVLTPLSYFETRGEPPVCEKTFERLLNPKPSKSSTQSSKVNKAVVEPNHNN